MCPSEHRPRYSALVGMSQLFAFAGRPPTRQYCLFKQRVEVRMSRVPVEIAFAATRILDEIFGNDLCICLWFLALGFWTAT